MNELCNVNYIRSLLERHGFRFSRSMGQNFLIDASVPERIAETAELDENTGVLEIGPGIGTLTRELCARAGKVAAVELDRALPPVLAETMSDFDNFALISGDILKTDIPALVRENFSGMRCVVCANLPYNITSAVLETLIEAGTFEEMTLMVQREVAQRVCAAPGGRDYGALSVFVQYYCQAQLEFVVPPEAFMPAPKVNSAVMRLKTRTQPAQTLVDETLFFRVVRAAFAQRRKILCNGLQTAFGQKLSKQELLEAIENAGFGPNVRGEELSIGDFARVAQEILSKMQ